MPTTSQLSDQLRRPIAGALLLVGAVLVAYHGAPGNDFQFDDHDAIVDNPAVHLEELTWEGLGRAAGSFPRRPIPMLTFAIDWWRGGGRAKPFQQTNVLIHVLNTLLVLVLLRRVIGAWLPGADEDLVHWVTLGATACWALHPIQVQAVTYVVQRMAALAATFVLLSALTYLQARRTAALRWWAGLAAAVLAAVATKENTWTLPGLIWLLEVGVVRAEGPLWRGDRITKALVGLSVVALVLVVIDLLTGVGPISDMVLPGYAARPFTLSERLLTQPRVIFFHLGQYLLPLPGRFSIAHDFALSRSLFEPASTLPALLGALAWIGAGGAALWRASTRPLGVALIWMVVTLAVESTVVPLELIFEHRMYLPSLGIVVVPAWVIARWRPGGGWQRPAVVLLLAVALTGLTMQRVPVWRDAISLWEDAVLHAPQSTRAWSNLGGSYARDERFDAAREAYRRALELEPNNAEAMRNMGKLLAEVDGEADRGFALLRRATELAPRNAETWLFYGNELMRRGDLAGAAQAYQRGIDAEPGHARLVYKRGLAAMGLEQYPVARRYFDRALAIAPYDLETRERRAWVRSRLGDAQGALEDCRSVLARAPQRGTAYLVLGGVFESMGRQREATDAFARACSLGVASACSVAR